MLSKISSYKKHVVFKWISRTIQCVRFQHHFRRLGVSTKYDTNLKIVVCQLRFRFGFRPQPQPQRFWYGYGYWSITLILENIFGLVMYGFHGASPRCEALATNYNQLVPWCMCSKLKHCDDEKNKFNEKEMIDCFATIRANKKKLSVLRDTFVERFRFRVSLQRYSKLKIKWHAKWKKNLIEYLNAKNTPKIL